MNERQGECMAHSKRFLLKVLGREVGGGENLYSKQSAVCGGEETSWWCVLHLSMEEPPPRWKELRIWKKGLWESGWTVRVRRNKPFKRFSTIRVRFTVGRMWHKTTLAKPGNVFMYSMFFLNIFFLTRPNLIGLCLLVFAQCFQPCPLGSNHLIVTVG